MFIILRDYREVVCRLNHRHQALRRTLEMVEVQVLLDLVLEYLHSLIDLE
jgi:hypothetical protein